MNLSRWSKLLAIVIPWSIAAILFVWIVSLRFPPSGIASFHLVFDGRSPWFTLFQPGERVMSPGPLPDSDSVGQRIVGEPVYASARQPGAYDTVEVAMEVRSIRQPLADIGLMRDEEAFQFEMKPLFSEALVSGWRRVIIGDRQGLVATGYPDDALVRSDVDRLMVWHASATSPLLADGPNASKTHDINLRGGHDFYAIPTNGRIRFTFKLQDMNRSREAKNRAAFRLTRDDEEIRVDSVSVSGSADKLPSIVFEQTVAADHLQPGVYRISFLADDDFFIRGVTTDAKHWVIGPRLYIGDTVGYAAPNAPVSIWSNSLHLAVDTFHKEGLQSVSLGSASAKIGRTHTSYPLDRAANERFGPQLLKTEKGSVRLVGDGFFTLERDALFFPRPRRLTPEADPVAEGIVAILTPYIPAESIGEGWWRVRASWTLPPTQESLRFSLGLPGMVARNGAFDIRNVQITYRRPPLSPAEWWRAVKRELLTAWRRL